MTTFADCECPGIETDPKCPVHGAMIPKNPVELRSSFQPDTPPPPPNPADDFDTRKLTDPVPDTAELDTTEFVPHRDLHAPPLPETHELDQTDLAETVIDPGDFLRGGHDGPGVWVPPDKAGDIVDAELVEEPAPGDLASGDRQAAAAFRESLRTGSTQVACDRLLAYLTASEPVRRANPDGEVTPFFGLGEPPSLEVAAVSVDGWIRALHATMFQRRLP
jgi:hypothetical protein